MPGTRCAVDTCNNSLIKTRKGGVKVHYHRFPKNDELCKLWINQCGKEGDWNPKNNYICSAHFEQSCYERDFKNELLGLPTRAILKESAIPSLNLASKALPLLFVSTENIEPNLEFENETSQVSQNDFDKLLEKHDIMREELSQLRTRYNIKSREVLALQKIVSCYKKKLANAQCKDHILKKVLTDNQIAILSEKKKKVHWTKNEITTALTIRCHSTECYEYLRNNLNYPLPGLSTLRAHASRMMKAEQNLES